MALNHRIMNVICILLFCVFKWTEHLIDSDNEFVVRGVWWIIIRLNALLLSLPEGITYDNMPMYYLWLLMLKSSHLHLNTKMIKMKKKNVKCHCRHIALTITSTYLIVIIFEVQWWIYSFICKQKLCTMYTILSFAFRKKNPLSYRTTSFVVVMPRSACFLYFTLSA